VPLVVARWRVSNLALLELMEHGAADASVVELSFSLAIKTVVYGLIRQRSRIGHRISVENLPFARVVNWKVKASQVQMEKAVV
jgi:hypothetical protein